MATDPASDPLGVLRADESISMAFLVMLERLSPTKIRETDKRKGKITDVITTEVSADGKSLHVVDDLPLYSQKMTYTANKQ